MAIDSKYKAKSGDVTNKINSIDLKIDELKNKFDPVYYRKKNPWLSGNIFGNNPEEHYNKEGYLQGYLGRHKNQYQEDLFNNKENKEVIELENKKKTLISDLENFVQDSLELRALNQDNFLTLP